VLATCIIPPVLCLLCLAVVLFSTLRSDRLDLNDNDAQRTYRKSLRARVIRVVFFTLFLIYPGTSSKLFSVFACREVEGISYVESDFSVQCYTSEWYRALAWVVPLLVLYALGIPLLCFIALWRMRRYADDVFEWQAYGFLYEGVYTPLRASCILARCNFSRFRFLFRL
jgi:hypothetical protein